MPQADYAGVLPKVCLGRRKCSTAEERGLFPISSGADKAAGAPRRFFENVPGEKTFFFLLRKKMKGNFLYKNFIRPAGTD